MKNIKIDKPKYFPENYFKVWVKVDVIAPLTLPFKLRIIPKLKRKFLKS